MVGTSTASRGVGSGVPQNASIGSNISTTSLTNKDYKDGATTHDIPSIIKAAGSAEAVIEHLLKERQAQSQQNAQLWRLVDKQRAMILGLNKDLERALKEKEKYRKKLKELLPNQGHPAISSMPDAPLSQQTSNINSTNSSLNGLAASDSISSIGTMKRFATEDIPSSPSAAEDSSAHSPIEKPVARRIMPPTDRLTTTVTSTAGEILDPGSLSPQSQDGGLNNLIIEAKTRAADSAQNTANVANDAAINISLPPSRSLPSKPPQIPPPQIPIAVASGDSVLQHSPVPASPPRKPAQAPYRDLRPDLTSPVDDEVLESDSDYDSLLEVNDITEKENRGRRRTREEDDRIREILAIQEAEKRSLSKKSKESNSKSSGEASQGLTSSSSVQSANIQESPNERKIFRGFVTEEFPDLLLPPNALPSIEIKMASSRMKPSRASLMSLTQLEEDPVFTLAIFSRADGGELWRVEKNTASLARLDQRLKQCSRFTAKTPDRSLFSGHAPAKLDARRQALNTYLDEVVNTQLDNSSAIELCRYLSTNTLLPNNDQNGTNSAEMQREAQLGKATIGDRPVMSGYLTKRGKNFGGWKVRYFVLHGPHLKYYETPGGAHLGTIKLQNARIKKQTPNNDTATSVGGSANNNASDDFDDQYRHAFLILEPKKKDPTALTRHVLCAESDHERCQWVDCLLQLTDYRDDDDEDAPSLPGTTDLLVNEPSGVLAKKKKQTQSKKQQQKHQSSALISPSHSKDGLIGVSYETMQVGEIPHGAPGSNQRRNSQDSDAALSNVSQPPFAISAPRDLQVITDSSGWGGRGFLGGGLAPPTVEEKKARKRSFFGFGTKTRTSSDGPSDSLFGDSNSSSPAASAFSNGSGGGPARHVFGAPLAEAVRYNAPVDVDVPLPAVVYRCVQYLEARNAVDEEGIFRLSGSNVLIKQLRERFNNEGDVNLLRDTTYHDIHAVASLLKMYLRELPTTILTQELHMRFLSVTEMADHEEKLSALAELATHLPQPNSTLLKYIVSFLIRIINNSDRNKMTVRNVGIVFSPTLNIPAPVFALLLQHYETVFGIKPEDYELPASVHEDPTPTRRPSLSSMSTAVTVDLPPRPSTSYTRESPDRHNLSDVTKNGIASSSSSSRNTQTPPPVWTSPVAQVHPRSTPTPPLTQQTQSSPLVKSLQQRQQQMTMNEPQHSSQPQSGSQATQRAANGSGFVLPAGYDVARAPVQKTEPDSIDHWLLHERPSNGGLAVHERNARRESAIFPTNSAMNHNQQQGARGCLGPGSRY
ncbi:Rho GTPase activating protein [Sporothrix epigloea]|uniref:Rho GTPase activating protein n=1 Tax=Sporothrix epigloea TaxID=1892477 RepID=A0ABP0D9B1_9PEZI